MKQRLLALFTIACVLACQPIAIAATPIDENNAESAVDQSAGDYTLNVGYAYVPLCGGNEKISVDIQWEPMNFDYNEDLGVWKPDIHDYEGGSAGWVVEQKTIRITNHSNAAIEVDFSFVGANENIKGSFQKASLRLESADAEIYRTAVNGVYPAPESTTAFQIDPTSAAITENQSLGTITVRITAKSTPTSVNGVAVASAAELQKTLMNQLDEGKTAFNIHLNYSGVVMFDAIYRALLSANDESATVGTIDLTISGATSIPDKFTYDGSNRKGIQILRTLSLPDVVSIGDFAFYQCKNLTEVSASKVKTIDRYAFRDCAVTSINLPEAITIGDFAFGNCTKLAEISIPKATTIDDYAFYNCAMTSMNLPEVITIGDYTFQDCKKLTELSSPKVTTIGKYAFYNCAMTSINLPETTALGSYAFHNCTKLTEVSIPKLATIGGYAFRNCVALQSITFGAALTAVGVKWLYNVTTENVTLILAHGQKSFSGDHGSGWTITETDVTGADTEFTGYTFKEIKIGNPS